MKRIFLRLKQPLRNERGEITFFACFFVVGIVMLISFLLLYASIRITCINIRNGAKMELNNLSGTIYADTYRSQRETNFEEYLNTLYSSSDYEADVFKPDKRLAPFNQAVQQKEKALLPLLSNEASIAFEQYQAAVQCRNSAVLEQAYASGYRTAVQMFAAGLGPQPPVPEHGEDNNG